MIFLISTSIFINLVIAQLAAAFHDSLGFLVAPRARACFFEDFLPPPAALAADRGPPETRVVDVFVQSGGKANLKLQVVVLSLFAHVNLK
jgi:hypothetical protein